MGEFGVGGHKHGSGPRWVPISAAVVAVMAALATLGTNQRSTQALIAKNQAIVLFTRSSDAYNYYQSKSIKEEIYQAAILTHPSSAQAAQRVVDREHATKQLVLQKASALEKQAEASDEVSQRFIHSHDTMEIGVTFLEVAIVILSISSVVGTLVLPIVAAAATAVGIGIVLAGLPV